MILLSVIIPTYNYIEGLHRCIDSVISQLPEDCECIVIDDGSGEDFVNQLKEYDRVMPNVRIEYCEHKGCGAARNAGISIARGKYIAFLDADDEMKEGFFSESREYLFCDRDLYIFGIDAHDIKTGETEHWRPGEHIFDSASDFADEYIRNRHLLVYSQCNKFYKSEIIKTAGIAFDENEAFGEDRIFNYRYIEKCRKISTSNIPMIIYHMHRDNSRSVQYIKDLFTIFMTLHKNKMDCFLNLSSGTTAEEKEDFRKYDLCRETENLIIRFNMNPKEAAENIDNLNSFISGGCSEICDGPDAVIVLGSSNCEYRAETAYFHYMKYHPVFFLSGGNRHASGDITEAEFMMKYFCRKGAYDCKIIPDSKSRNTMENLENAEKQLDAYSRLNSKDIKNIAVVTAWFHRPRVQRIIEDNNLFCDKRIFYTLAYGPNTGEYDWFSNETGKTIILNEIKKYR